MSNVLARSPAPLMALTAYDLALIAGAFTLLGVLIGALLSYRFGIRLAAHNARRAAGAHLRAAFAPELTALRVARMDKNSPIDEILVEALPKHAAAVEEYRFFVREKAHLTYQAAWQQYQDANKGGVFVASFEESDPHGVIERKIQDVLRFAEP
jgi:hypothetical protein